MLKRPRRRRYRTTTERSRDHEWSRYYRQALHDLEELHARFIEYGFARHSHEYYVIGVVEAGVQAYSYRGARHVTPAGQIFLVNPREPHTGEAATRRGYVYRRVYPRPALMQQVAREVAVHNALPFFTRAVIRDESHRPRPAGASTRCATTSRLQRPDSHNSLSDGPGTLHAQDDSRPPPSIC
jgi:AraC-like ligand binding domain